jgi:magnesium chelatase subunit I
MPSLPPGKPRTLGELKRSGYRPRSVKEEVRANLAARLRQGEEIFPGIVGYEKTVIPLVQNALLAQHDFVLLGLRGQAKTRMLRALPSLLDEWIPILAGSPIHEDPLIPVTAPACAVVAAQGDATPLEWLHRDERYQEKLATPDVTIADLIGDIDPIKAANEKLSLADPRVMHFGIVPRTNRGIFAINELPDLNTRIQVGLLNILEERDVQIRGFPVRLPLDLLLCFTANPEDYTSRGKIITPLKDRIGSQIVTHYPPTLAAAVAITRQEAWIDRRGEAELDIPSILRDIVEEITVEARKSEFVDQASGVSARLSISAMEALVSNVEKRALVTGEKRMVARICDVYATLPAITGKVELVYEGEQQGVVAVAKRLIGAGVKKVFGRIFPNAYQNKTPKVRRRPATAEAEVPEPESPYQEIIHWFAKGNVVDIHDTMASAGYVQALDAVPGLRKLALHHMKVERKEHEPVAMELLLEGLYQNSLIAKEELDGGVVYKDILKTMFESIEA